VSLATILIVSRGIAMTNVFKEKIADLIQKETVVDFPAIKSLLPSRSRISLVRDLQSLNCLSSYNHSGGYYTLPSIPVFDTIGIWRHRDAYFSRYGTLKETSKQMVDRSLAGMTHEELQQTLDVRVQNTLRDLVMNGLIGRDRIQGCYLYVNIEPQAREQQIGKRMGMVANDIALELNPYHIIEVLRAVIDNPGQSAFAIFGVLSQKHVKVSLDVVSKIFETYGLCKKNSP